MTTILCIDDQASLRETSPLFAEMPFILHAALACRERILSGLNTGAERQSSGSGKTNTSSIGRGCLARTIQADAGSLDQVLTNLLSNAVKYTPDAPVIEVKAHTEGDQVMILVRDHGIGIDEDDLGGIGERNPNQKMNSK